jgi:hypothetical protein
MAALLQITEQDMQDVLGNQQQGDKVVSNISGKAVEMIQQRLDMQTFIYMSNMAKSVKRSGEIWLSMAKDIFVEPGRKMKAITSGGTSESVELMRPTLNKETGEVEFENDLSEAEFDIAVDVGPSSSSKRQATVRALTGMMQVTQDPETMQVLSAMALMNIDGEGVSDVRDYFRGKLVRLGAVKATDQEAEQMQAEMQGQQPDPQSMYLMSAAKEAEAKAMKAQADTVLTVAKSEQTRAQTIETLSNVSATQQKAAIETAQAIGGALQQQQNTGNPPSL